MKNICILFFLFSFQIIYTQEVRELNENHVKYLFKNIHSHSGFWITHPDIDQNQYNVVLFRKTFKIDVLPDSLIIHITADNLYQLYINGKYVCMGPARNDLTHWNYETIDIRPCLHTGTNLIAVQVNNFGHNKAKAQFSFKTGFLLAAHKPEFEYLNSDDKTWKTWINKAYRERPVKWMYHVDIISGWYCINPNDSIVGLEYPWGWQLPGFNDSGWKVTCWLASPAFRYTSDHGPWLLVPRSVKLLHRQVERFPDPVSLYNINPGTRSLNGKDSIVIPANSKASFLIDNKKETMGFPEMIVSGGRGSSIKVVYAECLLDSSWKRGNRNDIKQKEIQGIYDIFLPDGNGHCSYQALWYRAFRFIRVEVQTKNEPLIINDFYNYQTHYPFTAKASFECSDSSYMKIWEAGWRTDLICSQDFYMSDAYYETMQYIADTRIHSLVTSIISGDYSLYRQALRHFDQSRIPDGLTLAAYPNDWYWVLPEFSLFWVDMVYDYTKMTGDKETAEEMLPGVRNVLNWFSRHINNKGVLGKLEWANPNGASENSSLFTLMYAYSLSHTAYVCDYLGYHNEASQYKQRAAELAGNVYIQSWDSKKGLLAETPDKTHTSQWTNIMGILTDAIPQTLQEDLLKRILNAPGMSHVGYVESFYLFEALKKTGLGSLYYRELKPWRDQLDEGLSTFKEIPSAEARSDCHPWSTCPLYYHLNLVLGIDPVKPGYEEIEISPVPGALSYIKGRMPTVRGMIEVDLKRKGEKGIEGFVILPSATKGYFLWEGKRIMLHENKNDISVLI